jgi:hypothetical protein
MFGGFALSNLFYLRLLLLPVSVISITVHAVALSNRCARGFPLTGKGMNRTFFYLCERPYMKDFTLCSAYR